jgi:solute carrier family 10 (sodium/bile acid cotransporter), member 7
MLSFLRQRWFLVALLAMLASGMLWSGALRPVVDVVPRSAIVALVMFLMALPLETAAMWRAVRRPGPVWLAVLLNAGLAPPLGWLAGHALPTELAIGIVVTATVPCTLVAATVWTRRAGGNDAVAILVTMITNSACFLVVPGWLKLLIGANVSLDYASLVWKLVLLVVLPITAAQLLRQWRPLGDWAMQKKTWLSDLAQLGILAIVLDGAVGCGEQIHNATNGSVLALGPVSIMIVAVVTVHLTLLFAGLVLARLLGMEHADRAAVAIAGSQKTLMVGIYVALEFGPLAILPMIAYHASQLLLDTIIADWLRGRRMAPTIS